MSYGIHWGGPGGSQNKECGFFHLIILDTFPIKGQTLMTWQFSDYAETKRPG